MDLDKNVFFQSKRSRFFAAKMKPMENTDKLIGRERECEELRWAMDSNRSELVILYGRRRIGRLSLCASSSTTPIVSILWVRTSRRKTFSCRTLEMR